MIQREWAFQRTVNVFLTKALPLDCYYTAIDIGSAGNARLGALRKARGIRPGTPDIIIVWHSLTLWIEIKAGSSLSEHQKTTRDRLVANGHMWAQAKSLEEIEDAIQRANIPLRATLGEIHTRIAEQNARLPKKPTRPRAKATRPLGTMSVSQYHRLNQKGLL